MIALAVPEELADDILAEGIGIGVGLKSSAAEIVIVGLAFVTTTITLLQGPDTAIKLAALIKARYAKPTKVTLKIKGGRGDMNVDITNDTDLATLGKLIQEGLFGDLD
jgi:hypothetical protein